MAKAFPILRGFLAEQDIDQTAFALKLGKSLTYVSRRITGKLPWTLDDQYRIMDMLKIPYERMHEVFPRPKHLKKVA